MTQVLKKDGKRLEDFNPEKIYRAVDLASDRAGVKLDPMQIKALAYGVKEKLNDRDIIPVEELHLKVIEELSLYSEVVAQSYRDYRGYKQNFNKIFTNGIIGDTHTLLNKGDKENANKNSELISTKKELTSGIVSKYMTLNYEFPTDLAKAHIEGDLHSHDTTDEIYGSINCCLFDMAKLLKDGFTLNGIQNTEPKHLETALDVVSDVILSASSQQFGGFTVPEIDSTLAPYVEKGYYEYLEKFEHLACAFKDRATYEKWVEDYVYDILLNACENKYDHRLNTINNSNGQTSFTTFTFGLDTSKWGRLVSKAILNARMKGLGKSRVSAIFPKLVFLHRAEINGNEDSPNYDIKLLAVDCSMLRMYPDWLSLDEDYLGEMFDKYGKAVSPMGCRAFLSPYYKKGGENPLDETDEPIFIGRANCGAVSLNLPRYALKSEGDLDKFYSLIDKYFALAVKKHVYKFNKLRGVKASSNPLFFCEGGCHITLGYDETIEKAIRTFTWSIGYIGLDEVCRFFTHKGIHQSTNLAVDILKYLQKKIDEAKKETGLLIALYSTPAESLCYRFLKIDRKDFGVIEGITDKEYYTNSYHVDVREKINAIEKQKVEKKCFAIAKGGRIVYNEFPHTHNKEAVLQHINFAMKQGLYYGVNLQLDTCLDCGHHAEFKDGKCSKCQSENIISINRVCGYLGYFTINGDSRANKGKQEERNFRVDHFN